MLVNGLASPVGRRNTGHLLNYGITGSLEPYAGGLTISEAAYRPFAGDMLAGFARVGFKHIIILNGHGGPQTAVLNEAAEKAGREHRVRTLVVNWWAD